MAVLNLFCSDRGTGDMDLALQALRYGQAHALSEASKCSKDGTRHPEGEAKMPWNRYCDDPNAYVRQEQLTTHLNCGMRKAFVDPELVVLGQEFVTTILRSLVRHRCNDAEKFKLIKAHEAQIVKACSPDDC